MTNKLTLLLDYYSREQRTLAKQLREALRERDYRVAARLQKGQYMVMQQLQALRALENKYGDELEHLDRMIGFLEKSMAEASEDAAMHAEMLSSFLKQREELESLRAPNSETSVLRESMEKLLAGQIDAFCLTLSKSSRLHIHIKRVRRTAILMLPELIRHRSEYTIQKRQLRQLRQLRFAFYDHKDKLMAFEPLSTTEDLERILVLWLKITCLVFDFREFRDDSEIRYFSA